jgi:hypothetical protein
VLSPNIFLHSGHATALTPAPALTDGASSRGRLPAAPALSTRSRRGHSLLRQVGEDAQRSTSVPLHTRVVLVLLHTVGDHLDAALSGALILPWFSAVLTARLASTTQPASTTQRNPCTFALPASPRIASKTSSMPPCSSILLWFKALEEHRYTAFATSRLTETGNTALPRPSCLRAHALPREPARCSPAHKSCHCFADDYDDVFYLFCQHGMYKIVSLSAAVNVRFSTEHSGGISLKR